MRRARQFCLCPRIEEGPCQNTTQICRNIWALWRVSNSGCAGVRAYPVRSALDVWAPSAKTVRSVALRAASASAIDCLELLPQSSPSLLRIHVAVLWDKRSILLDVGGECTLLPAGRSHNSDLPLQSKSAVPKNARHWRSAAYGSAFCADATTAKDISRSTNLGDWLPK